MNPTTQQLRALGYDVTGGKAVPAADKPRARRFKVSQWKSWIDGPGVFLPLRCVNESNNRDHWAAKAKRAKEQRYLTYLSVFVHLSAIPKSQRLPAVVTLSRYGPKLLDAGDNLPRSLKAVRDGVADAFGTNDGPDGGLTFEYRQEVAKFYGCRIEVAARKDGTP